MSNPFEYLRPQLTEGQEEFEREQQKVQAVREQYKDVIPSLLEQLRDVSYPRSKVNSFESMPK